MKKLQHFFCIILFIITFSNAYTQTNDTLWVYPNPFATIANIHFETSQADTISLTIFDITGHTQKTFFQNILLPNGSYSFQWIANNTPEGLYLVSLKIGTTKTINKKLLKTDNTTTAITDLTNTNFQPYPNPTTDQITLPQDGTKTITIANLTGQVVKTLLTDQKVISLSDLPNATYIFTISTTNKPTSIHQITVTH